MVPTIGRRMYFFTKHPEKFNLTTLDATEPFDAGVIFAHPNGWVNVQVTDHVGNTKTFEFVEVLHEHEAGWEKPFWVEWMPYQKEQAAKQETKSPVELGAMSHSQLQEFRVQLETKTSWGRNELKDLLLKVLSS